MAGLKIEGDGRVLRVTLARPERRNAFDAALIAELTKAFADVGDSRAVVLTGEGQSFCAGADVEWQRSAIDLSFEENVEDALRLYRMCETIDRCPAPVVARVHGYALGGGSGLVAFADIAVAATDAVFGFSEVRLGIMPAVISPVVFAGIGTGAARRWFATGAESTPSQSRHRTTAERCTPAAPARQSRSRVTSIPASTCGRRTRAARTPSILATASSPRTRSSPAPWRGRT